MTSLKAPFPYFGGKSRVAEEVWSRFGPDVRNYVEPFCGSMAVLLHQDNPVTYETVNDLDGLLTNFWRAIKFDPEGVAALAQAPQSQIDLMARHNWVYERKERIIEMQKDPRWYDVEAAAYWVYVRCNLIGGRGAFSEKIGSRVPNQGRGQGIHTLRMRHNLVEYFGELSDRLWEVTIQCGDWQQVLKTPLKEPGTPAAVFLDPPYKASEVDTDIYEHFDSHVFNDVLEWCVEHGEDPDLRIALCGYDGNATKLPETWTTWGWTTDGGYSNISCKETRGKDNASRERIWFSPHCYDPTDLDNTLIGNFITEGEQ